MEIKEILAQIRAAAGEDAAPKISGLLQRVEAEFAAVTDDLKAANAESKERKLKLRDLQTQLEEATGKVTEYEAKVNNPETAQELASLKQFKSDVLKARRATFAADFAPVLKHANFEKAKEQFRLPKPAEDGTIDLSKIPDADIEHNLAKLAEYRAIGLFSDAAAAPPAGAFNMPRNGGSGAPPKLDGTEGGLAAHIASQMQHYK